MSPALETLAVVGILTVAAYTALRKRFSPTQTPVSRAKEAYANGEIDATEFETQLEYHLDDRNGRIRTVVDDVPGVGPGLSTAIAREYDSLEDLRGTDQERLESIPGVGEQRATAVLERVSPTKDTRN